MYLIHVDITAFDVMCFRLSVGVVAVSSSNLLLCLMDIIISPCAIVRTPKWLIFYCGRRGNKVNAFYKNRTTKLSLKDKEESNKTSMCVLCW